nr:uncharacterized protein LOC112028156 isoform X2 [Quercus suber]
MTADDDVWEAYIKDHPDAVTYRDKILGDYCDLCVIYGKESQHSRSSYSDIKMEINTNTLGMGIDDIIGDTQSPVTEFEISHLRRKRKSAPSSTSACIQKVRRTIKKETQEAVEGKPCVVKTYLGTEEVVIEKASTVASIFLVNVRYNFGTFLLGSFSNVNQILY